MCECSARMRERKRREKGKNWIINPWVLLASVLDIYILFLDINITLHNLFSEENLCVVLNVILTSAHHSDLCLANFVVIQNLLVAMAVDIALKLWESKIYFKRNFIKLFFLISKFEDCYQMEKRSEPSSENLLFYIYNEF